MGFIYSIEIYEISHLSFGSSHQKCLTCATIFVNTAFILTQALVAIQQSLHLLSGTKIFGQSGEIWENFLYICFRTRVFKASDVNLTFVDEYITIIILQ